MLNNLEPTNLGDVLILLYHGLYEDGLDLGARNSSGKHIRESAFRQQMQTVKERYSPVSMADVEVAYTQGRSLPERAVAVTFDDGYASWYSVVWPILQEYGIPATFYLATGFIGTGRMLWTDALEMMILGSRLSLRTSERLHILAWVKKQCKAGPFAKIAEEILAVQRWTEVDPEPNHPIYEMLTWEMAREMAQDHLVTFGAHTVDHAPLARISEGEMRWQVSLSLQTVAQELQRDALPRFFSYPEGQEGDFNEAAIRYLRDVLHLTHCPTAIAGLNNVTITDPFRLYRCMVGGEGNLFPLV